MSGLVDAMISERSRPAVLALAVLRIRSERPDSLIFIFEGPEDVGVYEQWLGKIASCPKYEPLPSTGKKQVIGYIENLIERRDDLLQHVYAFVDRDFELAYPNTENVHDLPAYSFENLICCRESLGSLLLDEFRCATRPDLQNKILQTFDAIWGKAKNSIKEVNFVIFACQRSGRTVIKKPERLSHFLNLELKDVSVNYFDIDDVVSGALDDIDTNSLRNEFNSLDECLQYRGKYLYMIFKKWIEILGADRVAANSEFFADAEPLRACAPQVTHRRLASAVKPPSSLVQFVNQMRQVNNLRLLDQFS